MIVEEYEIPNKDMGQISAWILDQSFSPYYVKCESEGDIVYVHFTQTLAGVDKQALDSYLLNYQQDSFKNELIITDNRNEEGFVLYKKIFSHISANEPIVSIDNFISASDKLHKLRNFLKDGNFETAVRYMEKSIKPLATGENGMFPNGYETYRLWVREICKKYNNQIDDAFLDQIEHAAEGEI